MTVPYKKSPFWYTSIEEQKEWVYNFMQRNYSPSFTIEQIPPEPDNFRLRPGEVPLLVVNLPDGGLYDGLDRTFGAMISELSADLVNIDFEFDYSDFKREGRLSYKLRLCSGEYVPGLKWVVYRNYMHYGQSPEFVRMLHEEITTYRLAGVEILQVANMFPDLRQSWNSRSRATFRSDVTPAPYLSGIIIDRFDPNTGWCSEIDNSTPAFTRRVRRFSWLNDNRKLSLVSVSSKGDGLVHCSPVIRDL